MLAPFSRYPEEVAGLKRELEEVRRDIVGLMPSEFQDILLDFYSCQSRKEASTWEQQVVEEIVQRAVPGDQTPPFGSGRAACPLCKDEPTSPYARGFSLPDGLSRHLIGWGKIRQCRVVAAAFALAREYWNDKFHPEEEAARAEQERRKRERRKTEALYRTAPDQEPELIDEGFYGAVRTPEQLAWAEKRLRELGFQTSQEGNVRSYTREHNAVVVYADPRSVGEIRFRIYEKPVPTKSHRLRCRKTRSVFSLQDRWKNDIQEKYESRVMDLEIEK